MDETLRQEIEDLRQLRTKELKLRYRELFGDSSSAESPLVSDTAERAASATQLFRSLQVHCDDLGCAAPFTFECAAAVESPHVEHSFAR